ERALPPTGDVRPHSHLCGRVRRCRARGSGLRLPAERRAGDTAPRSARAGRPRARRRRRRRSLALAVEHVLALGVHPPGAEHALSVLPRLVRRAGVRAKPFSRALPGQWARRGPRLPLLRRLRQARRRSFWRDLRSPRRRARLLCAPRHLLLAESPDPPAPDPDRPEPLLRILRPQYQQHGAYRRSRGRSRLRMAHGAHRLLQQDTPCGDTDRHPVRRGTDPARPVAALI
ncbi:MAG: integral membrane rhomboid family serine protease MJ0610.1, partial [uncultured Rubrobacteraceae bacterium]